MEISNRHCMWSVAVIMVLLLCGRVLGESTLVEENFDDAWPPKGWTTYMFGDANDGWTNASPGYGETGKCAFHDGKPSGWVDDWLVSPRIDLNENHVANLTLRFNGYNSGQTDSGLIIKISTGEAHPLSNEYVKVLQLPGTQPRWQSYKVSLEQFGAADHLYLGIRHYWDGPSPQSYIDTVNLSGEELPPGPPVFTHTIPAIFDTTHQLFTTCLSLTQTLSFPDTLPATITETLSADSFVITDTLPIGYMRWGGYYASGGPESSLGFVIRMFENEGPGRIYLFDHPGLICFTCTLSVSSLGMSQKSAGSVPVNLYQANFEEPMWVEAGKKYWASVQMVALTGTVWGMVPTPDSPINGAAVQRGVTTYGDALWHTNSQRRNMAFALYEIPEPVIALFFYVISACVLFKIIKR